MLRRIGLSCLALGLLLTSIGCQKPASPFIYGGGVIPEGLNPNLSKNGWNEANSLLLSRLFQVNEKGELEPDLFTDYSVSPDGLTYRFRVRMGVVWQDGTPLTVEDVAYTFKSIFDPKTATRLDDDLTMVDVYLHAAPNLFVVKLKAPCASFVARLSEIAVLPKHILESLPTEEINKGAFDRNPIGSGPYKLVSKTSDTEWRFEWNDRYYRPVPDPIRQIRLLIVPDDTERARQALAGAFHLTQIKPQNINELLTNGDLVIYRFSSGSWRGLPQNLRRPHLQDPRVRRAINLAIDREAIVQEAAQGAARSAYLPVLPASFAYDMSAFLPGRDADRARRILADAGWEPGTDGILRKHGTRLDYRIGIWKDDLFRRSAGELIKQQLREVGISVVLDLVSEARYEEIVADMGVAYDTLIGGWSGLLDPDRNLSRIFASDGSQNYMRYKNHQVDKLLDSGRKEQLPGKRKQIYGQLLTLLYDDAVFLPLVYPDYLFVAKQGVQGLKDGMIVDGWYQFTRDAYKWRLVE